MTKFPAAIGGIGQEFGFCQGADFSMQLQNESLLRTVVLWGEIIGFFYVKRLWRLKMFAAFIAMRQGVAPVCYGCLDKL